MLIQMPWFYGVGFKIGIFVIYFWVLKNPLDDENIMKFQQLRFPMQFFHGECSHC